jgi:D-glycero-alpha-D-manno-heptose 1-phosphate guanylyltransferase
VKPVVETIDIPALLLVGGLGTRLRAVVPSAPKPLAAVGKKTFLDLLIRQLRNQGFRRVIMGTGHLADQIEGHFRDGRDWDVEIEYSRELQPLGTGGAVKFAEQRLRGCGEFLVMNGDSFVEADFHRLLQVRREASGIASMAVRDLENASRYGTVQTGTGGRITAFLEKTGKALQGTVNAGVYAFGREILQYLPEGPSSLEKDIFPALLPRGIYTLEQSGMFIDIGTPEDYARAQEICERLYEAASLKQ